MVLAYGGLESVPPNLWTASQASSNAEASILIASGSKHPGEPSDIRSRWPWLDEVSGNGGAIFAFTLMRGRHNRARQLFDSPALVQKAIVSAHAFCHCCAICM